jgi:AcrR family transcriptional regulator
VSKGTVYLYFESKDALFRAVVEKRVITQLAGAEELLRTHQGTARELLVAVIHRIWDAMSNSDMVCLSRLVQAELTQFPEVRRFYFEHVIQRHRRLLTEIARRGIRSGEFHRSALVVIPRMVPPLVMQLNQNRFLFGDLDQEMPAPARLRDALIQMVLAGIGCDPTGVAASPPRQQVSRGPARRRVRTRTSREPNS